ncbi:hypothetical protein B0H10DRAFT_1635884, partial [Mycena sp. CBHHK59/15]
EVNEILSNRKTALSELATEISELEWKLDALRSKHTEQVSEIARYTQVLSPVRRLPPEIIGEIFLYFTPKLWKPELPWKLGHICRRWRMIALSLHQLWSVL